MDAIADRRGAFTSRVALHGGGAGHTGGVGEEEFEVADLDSSGVRQGAA
ncbi:hypothetical protein [Streptomyces sp. NPDC002889]